MSATEVIFGGITTLVGGIGGGLLSGWYQDRRDKRDQPRLKLDFNPATDKFETAWTGEHPFDGVILRASVRNEGTAAALNCRVFLVAVSEVQASGHTGIDIKDSRQVSWAGWNFNSKVIPREVRFYVDLVRFRKESSGWDFPFEPRLNQDQPLKDYKGTYRFRLVAVADNSEPAFIDVDVEYRGDWHGVRAWKPTR